MYKRQLYDLRVAPGDAVVRRHADQLVSAIPVGMQSPGVRLYARYQSSPKWEAIAMQPTAAGSFAGGYQFLFAGLPENVEYYVTAGAMTSKHFNIRVTDLPSVKQIRVTYRLSLIHILLDKLGKTRGNSEFLASTRQPSRSWRQGTRCYRGSCRVYRATAPWFRQARAD